MYTRQLDDWKRGFFNMEADGMYVENTGILLIFCLYSHDFSLQTEEI